MSKQEKVQDNTKRLKNFKEVSSGFCKSDALEEARQFPQLSDHSRDPKCPLGVDISSFVRTLREGNLAGALKIIKEKNNFPAICGRVCSAPCEKEFSATGKRSPIGIRALERYVADCGKKWSFNRKKNQCGGKKVAIIGSGPSGLSAAVELAKNDYQVTIFELLPSPGGVLFYEIPSFRLPKEILEKEIEELEYLGVEIKTSSCVGYSFSLEDLLKQGFSALLLAVGLSGDKFFDSIGKDQTFLTAKKLFPAQQIRCDERSEEFSCLPGIYLGGVYYSDEVLIKTNFAKLDLLSKKEPVKLGENVVIIGSNDSTIDCARICARFGKKVMIVSEGTEEEIGISQRARAYAKEEGIHFEPLRKPLEILSKDGATVSGLKCISMDYADPNASGKWLLIPVPDSQTVIDADTVIIASGKRTGSSMLGTNFNPKVHSDGTVWVDEKTGMTSLEGVFACGGTLTRDCAIIDAFVSGKKAAQQIDEFLVER